MLLFRKKCSVEYITKNGYKRNLKTKEMYIFKTSGNTRPNN